ncbi:sodium-translocating pyrophosphatase [Caldivirga sp. UBA161]|uniref:sodium-translocating pyrophosphatase n=1 Tax=Caldivirga sp. UBA161 TaxID=1915569 RepID=UPI0025C604B3|nr:sodium-translocating pyrophosphatase [Caldivirga sp. UBA161]
MVTSLNPLSLPLVIPLIGLAYALYNTHWVLSRDPGDEKLKWISNLIAKGAGAFLKREYSVILPTGLILMLIIGATYYLLFHSPSLAAYSMISFALGAIGSGLAGYIGMYVTTRSASRTAAAARGGIDEALKVSFRAGSVMGIILASIAVLTVSSLYLVYSTLVREWAMAIAPVALGASLMSLFIRVAGGIYTKAADWGADMVGKVESNIPEDDPRNPGVIADNVGDNVGDVAGMASDVYESFIVVLTGSLILISVFNIPKIFASLILSVTSLVLLSTLLGVQVVRGKVNGRDIASASMRKLSNSLIVTVLISSLLITAYSMLVVKPLEAMALSVSVIMGFVTAVAVLYITQYFTHYTYGPVKDIAKQASLSASNVIVAGYSYGLLSATPVILIVAVALGISFYLGYAYIPASMPIEGGIMGTALASVGLLSLAGIVISLDSYGPVSDNANGLVEMAGLGDETRMITDALDAIGNTYKATTKGYAIASAGLASLVLFIGFIYEAVSYSTPADGALSVALNYLNVINPLLLVGILMGAVLVYVFSSRLLIAVGKAASELVEEIRRQFRVKRILEGLDKPDYDKAIDIATRHALREFMAPALLAVAMPILVGLTLGWVALAGLILGTIIVGFPRALLMANAGGAWDNAKKLIEAMLDPELGGKGSAAHKNAVIGDVVGDPFKDTAGPSLNPLIKVVNTVSIVFAPAVAMISAVNPVAHLGYLILLFIHLI